MEYTKDMKMPHAFKCEPTAVEVEAGKSYSWCTCGLSEKSPFCDASHRQTWYEENGEEVKPWKSLKFTAEETGEVWLCNCKQTSTPPFCDGTHRKVAASLQ
jgi:CDGSH-type Zn-finger protein